MVCKMPRALATAVILALASETPPLERRPAGGGPGGADGDGPHRSGEAAGGSAADQHGGGAEPEGRRVHEPHRRRLQPVRAAALIRSVFNLLVQGLADITERSAHAYPL